MPYADPARSRAHNDSYYRANRERINARQRAYRKSPESVQKRWAYHLKRTYGITADQYDKMMQDQGGVCAICGQGETASRGGITLALGVDHDHSTGAVRGLLCVACNVSIGKMQDDPARLRAAAEYIERSTMPLSRDKAEENGLKFSIEGETRPEAPDQEIWAADLTIDGHTERFAGKSEEDLLEQAERVLISRGRLQKNYDEAGGGEPTVAQETDEADLAAFQAQRDETPEEITKQLEQRGLDSGTEIVQEPGEADDAA